MSAKEIDLDKVIRVIPPDEYNLPEPHISLAPDPTNKYCPHEHVLIYEHYRLLKCKDCNATLDAFDFLVVRGKQERCAFSNMRILHWEIKHKQEDIEDLKKEISKLKALKRKI